MDIQGRSSGDDTRYRLLNWSEAQKASEGLAGHILKAEGFKDVDPSHPLGGPDGLVDIKCKRDGIEWVGASYFPNGKQTFSRILKKFTGDTKLIPKDGAVGFIFITNQPLSLTQREQLKQTVTTKVEIFHLERLVHILDEPENYGHRSRFLGISISMEEQIASIARNVRLSLMHEEIDQDKIQQQEEQFAKFHLELEMIHKELQDKLAIVSQIIETVSSNIRS